MDEDAIIRKRLLLDERTLKRCLVKYFQLQKRIYGTSQESREEQAIEADLGQVQYELSLIEHAVRRQRLYLRMSEREIQNYEEQSKLLESKKEETSLVIEQLQKELELAKEDRKRKIEYDTIAQTIIALPSRAQTLKKIEMVREECVRLSGLQEEQEQLFERRKEKLREVFSLFEEVQEDFRSNPSFDETVFYMGEDEGEEDVSSAVPTIEKEEEPSSQEGMEVD